MLDDYLKYMVDIPHNIYLEPCAGMGNIVLNYFTNAERVINDYNINNALLFKVLASTDYDVSKHFLDNLENAAYNKDIFNKAYETYEKSDLKNKVLENFEGNKLADIGAALYVLFRTSYTNEDEFVRAAMENSVQSQESELKKARKLVKQYEKRVAELDKLFTRLYEDNISGKISDERFEMMSKGYETEQADLKVKISDLSAAIEIKEQKSSDTSQFLEIVRKYIEITELTPEIMHELIERIVVHAPDKSSGHRVQQIDIYYRFNIAVSTAIADRREYDKKRKAA